MSVETNAIHDAVTDHNIKLEKASFPSIEDKLKPLLVSMKLLGIYIDPTNKVEPSETYATKTNSPGWWGSINRVYSYTVLLLLWCNFGRCAVGLFPLDGGLPLRIIVTTWMLLCAFNATILITACQKLTHFRTFYKHWNSMFHLRPFTDRMDFDVGFPQHVRLGTAAGWFLTSVNNAVLGVLLFGDLPVSPAYIQALTRPFPESKSLIVFIMFLHVFQTAAWFFPVVFIATFARVIRAQFLQLGKTLSKQIEKADGHIPDQLPELRFRYMQLCQAVVIANRSFKWLLGVRFILDIFLACFVSYQIINGPSDPFVIAVDVFWLGGDVMGIIVSAICSADVHDAVSVMPC